LTARAALASLLLAPALLAAAGCLRFGGTEPPLEVRSFDLQPPLPAAVPPEAEGEEVLWVEPFDADPALDREEMVWRRAGEESGAYERYRWARPPAEAVREVLADALARSGIFAVVATDPRALRADYLLRGHLARFEEVDGEKGWEGAVEVRVVLLRAADGEEVLRRTYARSEAAPARNPAGVVRALHAGLDAVAATLDEDVRRALAAERERPSPPR
jgi:ABC-type uncharacterized transport system auxiliary subunit